MAAAKPAPKDKSLAPIVIKRVKKGGHGFHGGVWKIAYADFVTAMMAFFLLMWVLGSTTTGDLAGISAYFQNPLRVSIQGGQGSGDATRPIKGGGENLFRSTGQEARADSLSNQRRVSDSSEAEEQARLEQQRLEQAKDVVERQLEADPLLAQMRNQVYIAVGVEGLRIQIVDDKKRPMFAVGSAEPYPYTRRLLQMIGRVLSELTNQVRFEGHTDSRLFGNGPAGYGNWELSSERANAARREVVIGGMAEQRTAQVSGYADSVRLNPEDPSDPINRRISITVLRKKPTSPSPAAAGDKNAAGDGKGGPEQALGNLNGIPKLPAQAAAEAINKPGISVPKPPALADAASPGSVAAKSDSVSNSMAYQLPPRPGLAIPMPSPNPPPAAGTGAAKR